FVCVLFVFFFFFQAEDGIRDGHVTGVQTCALPIFCRRAAWKAAESRLYRVVAGLEKPSMPLDGKLTAAQISAIKDWLDQGAVWEIGRASCRERVRMAGGGREVKRKKSTRDMRLIDG